MLRVGVITLSDRATQGVYHDQSGPAVQQLLQTRFETPLELIYRLLPDEPEQLVACLVELADVEQCALICTTGGTGPAPRDRTPEATRRVIELELPGFGEAMRLQSLAETPTAILARGLAGVRGRSLIINLPGSPGAIATNLGAVIEAVPKCLELLGHSRPILRPIP